MLPHTLSWAEPLTYLAGMADWVGDHVLLYSGMRTATTGRTSLLALHPVEQIEGNDFGLLKPKLHRDTLPHEYAWFGFLGYGLKDRLERLPKDMPGQIQLPDLWMTRFRTLLIFDHDVKSLICWSEDPTLALPVPKDAGSDDMTVTSLSSNMSKAHYLQKVQTLIEAIHAGELYQANLTRKFYGEWQGSATPAQLFIRLTKISPAPYSAFIRMGETCLLSSSPERFLQIGADGKVTAQPIKGSAPRHADSTEDAKILVALKESAKDKAENLMIVDLMRNDLARACMAGSVEVDKLFEITSYATVHHMASTITGRKKPECDALDVVMACFPPGSMTGAPKIRAMEYCTQLEQMARGAYSGAIGWFGGDGSCDLSVVIRTLILQGNRFEFQVGGGIVADSTPEAEWEETLVKARGIAGSLGLSEEQLRAL